MTTTLSSGSGAANVHTEPRTPLAQDDNANDYNFQQTSSPLASPQLNRPTDDMEWNNNAESPKVVDEKKRKYSAKLFQWTQELWETARQDMERRSSGSSTDSLDSARSQDVATLRKQLNK